MASESKRSVESWAGIGTNGHDGCERTTAASNRTDREDSGRKREQTVVSRAAGVDELQQQTTGQPDGEDSGRKREQAITREPGGGCERTSNSSKQPTGQTGMTTSVGKREQAISSEPDGQQHRWTRRMWTKKQQQQAADRTDGEDIQRWQARASDQ